jgi:two-component sensor histidine kinase/ABC-type uncharacterized transport system substrate-binding protein
MMRSVIILVFLLSCAANAAERKQVLFISSYHPGFPTFFEQVKGIKSVFKDKDIVLDIEFMDTKRFNNRTNINNFKRSLGYKLNRGGPYDLIISGDDNALHFIIKEYKSLFRNLPVVFFGVNNIQLALDQNKNPNITGIVEHLSMRETIKTMIDLHPGMKNVYAIVDETPSGQGDLKTFYSLQENFPKLRFKELSLVRLTYEELASKLRGLDPVSAVLLLSAYRDRAGKKMLFHESLSIITASLKKPLYHLWYHGMGDGVLGGKVISHFHQGAEAAEIALDILKGKPAAEIQVTNKSPNKFIFDYRELKRLDIDESRLPDNSIILFKPESIFKKHFKAVVLLGSTIIILVILLMSMWININTRKHVEDKLRNSENNLKLSLKEKEIMLSEIHHRVKNNMQVISSLVSLQSELIRDEYDYQLFIEFQNRIKSMALVHEKLYQTKDFSHINLHEYIEELVKEIIHRDKVETGKIKVEISAQDILLDLDRSMLCGLIINELISNACKYAFPDGREGTISITFKKEGDIYFLMVKDTGVGIEKADFFEQSDTLGLQLIEGLVDQLNGTKEFSSRGGVYVAVSFPV